MIMRLDVSLALRSAWICLQDGWMDFRKSRDVAPFPILSSLFLLCMNRAVGNTNTGLDRSPRLRTRLAPYERRTREGEDEDGDNNDKERRRRPRDMEGPYTRSMASRTRTKEDNRPPWLLKEDGEQETDPHRLAQRQKQIDLGRNTLGYDRYIASVPRRKRSHSDPWTPDKRQVCSKRSWDGQIRKWRRMLHEWDENVTKDGEEEPGAEENLEDLEDQKDHEEQEGQEGQEGQEEPTKKADSSQANPRSIYDDFEGEEL